MLLELFLNLLIKIPVLDRSLSWYLSYAHMHFHTYIIYTPSDHLWADSDWHDVLH